MEVKLRPVIEEDAWKIVKWRNNPLVKQNLYSQDDITVETHLKYFHKVVENKECYQFIIEIPEIAKDIGTIFIKNIDYRNKNGEFGIFIGEDGFRNKGIGKQAIKKMLEFGFCELLLNKIRLTVLADNESAIGCYLKVGFVQCAYYKEEVYRKGEFYDVIGMEIIRKDWDKINSETESYK
ncbi:UDP-4-amino-4,6-dideoxy-N-acetyl-beta-L-altrosamine N-acetyltransferase [Lachnospiraceae bacterium]|nr:UDP-4-amino-4,6-dideoxy-N-acetyl-beta-L-altrosamine N-acetyltransferase [uncultured Schaedlerella sp.]MCI9152210.1 UDP-4-amino-4,6-dideoxy-N-acetyl-beta-L-altrosamine N-acetyltransferase [Ruminococcus sp.]NBI57896.1 UDP-4-amino-4,6-dideoxy-N-acetyl-beta-L-altrosamine N-acetyltransferase [Lachnospiraceae bacterium]